MNEYGPCYHTKYEGCPPCIHDAYRDGSAKGYLDGYTDAEKHYTNRSINTYPHSSSDNVTIDLSLNEWEYVLNGLSALLESSYAWGWADTAVQTEIHDIAIRIERIINE